MATAVAEVNRARQIPAPRAEVYRHLSDVEGIVDLMASLREWEPLEDDGAYRFTLKTYSALGYRFQPSAELRLSWSPDERVEFEPVGESSQRAQARGAITVADRGEESLVTISVDLQLDLPIPSLLAGAAAAVLRHELQAGFERMLHRLHARSTEVHE